MARHTRFSRVEFHFCFHRRCVGLTLRVVRNRKYEVCSKDNENFVTLWAVLILFKRFLVLVNMPLNNESIGSLVRCQLSKGSGDL